MRETGQNEAPQARERSFRSQTEVRAYLDAEGYKVALSTVNLHAKKRLLMPNQDGVYPLSAVEAYIRAAQLKRKDGSEPGADDVLNRKAQLEAQKLAEQLRKLQFANDLEEGRYVLKDQVELDLADRARVLQADLLNFFRTNIDDFLIMVGGNLQAAPQALEWWEERLEDWMDRYAKAGKISLEAA